MTDERKLDEFDRELRALLRVEPSPDFMAGVRARLPEKRSRPAWWWLAPALAVGLAALLLARTVAREEPAAAPDPRPLAVAPPRPAEPAAPDLAPASPVVRAAVPRRRPAPDGPDVIIVSPEDERALLAYLATTRARRGRALAALSASTSPEAPLSPPAPIDVTPIETPPLSEPAGPLPGTRSDS